MQAIHAEGRVNHINQLFLHSFAASRNWRLSLARNRITEEGMAKSSEAPNEQTFETAIGRLEGLVEEMERDDLPLERLIVNYEEGIKLVKTCQQKLAEAEKKIEIIQRQANADPELKAFDPEARADSPGPLRKPGPRDANLF